MSDDYLEAKRLHAEAQRLRDEAAELNATADRKLRDGNYALGQARHRLDTVAQMERSIAAREQKLKELGEPELVAREQAAAAKLAEAFGRCTYRRCVGLDRALGDIKAFRKDKGRLRVGRVEVAERRRSLIVRAAFAGTLLVAVVSAYFAWRSWRQAPEFYDIILLTTESTRLDAIGPETTPNIWRLAQRGSRFTRHRGSSAWTSAGIVSILTGLSAFEHGIHTRDQTLPERWPLPLKDLAARGWKVGALQSFMQLPVYAAHLGLSIEAGVEPEAWIAARLKAKEPYFLWYHYLPTHLPYNPAPAFMPDWQALLPPGDEGAVARLRKVMTQLAIPAGSVTFEASDRPAIRALYLAGFRQFDAWFAELWSFLEARGRLDRTIIVLTADHGEEHLERGQVGHASSTRNGHLHEELVRLPLIIWAPPGRGFEGRVVQAPTTHTDIMPTIMATLGVSPTWALSGYDLAKPLPPDRPWNGVTSKAGFTEAEPQHIRRFIFARVEGRWKLHLVQDEGVTTDRQLYDLETDPGETTNRLAEQPEISQRLEAALTPLIAGMRHYRPDDTAKVATAAPVWRRPIASSTVAYDDLGGRFRLEWEGEPDAAYHLQYQAGEGLLSITGEMEVIGTTKDFGIIDRGYWNTWLVPYGTFRLRVGVPGRDDLWTDWITLRAVR